MRLSSITWLLRFLLRSFIWSLPSCPPWMCQRQMEIRVMGSAATLTWLPGQNYSSWQQPLHSAARRDIIGHEGGASAGGHVHGGVGSAKATSAPRTTLETQTQLECTILNITLKNNDNNWNYACHHHCISSTQQLFDNHSYFAYLWLSNVIVIMCCND